MDLSRKRDRERLKSRREPYWQRLSEGAYLGYRAGPGTWIARYRGRDRKHRYQTLGEHPEYDVAKKAAEIWLMQLTGSAARVTRRSTVRAALDTYLEDLRRHGRQAAAKDAAWRFRKYVDADELADIELERLTRDDVEEWRQRKLKKGRAARTVERQLRSIRAGLNRALELGHVGNAAAWTLKALRDDVDDSGETAVLLSAAQRAALVVAGSEVGPFLRGIELTGARPGELAAAKVSDFDGATVRLSHRKGRPPKLRTRYVVLSTEGIDYFKKHTADRPAAEPIFREASGIAWRRHMWARRIRDAISVHNTAQVKEPSAAGSVPAGASAYSFRHARISELLQLHGVDPLTVAHQCGTSLAMIEKAYYKFLPNAMRDKLAAIK